MISDSSVDAHSRDHPVGGFVIIQHGPYADNVFAALYAYGDDGGGPVRERPVPSLASVPVMLEQSGGKIINLSGAGATNAWSNMSAYCSSKAAVVRLTEVLAQELDGKGITVNALGPGSVHTSMWDRMTEQAAQAGADFIHQLGLMVTSGGGASIDECAELAVWLASSESGALTGRLISAATDDFRGLPLRIGEIMAGDAYTLRRVGLD